MDERIARILEALYLEHLKLINLFRAEGFALNSILAPSHFLFAGYIRGFDQVSGEALPASKSV